MTYEEARHYAERWLKQADEAAVTTREIQYGYENVSTYIFVEKMPEHYWTKEDPTKPHEAFSPAILIVDKKSGAVEYDTFPHAFVYTKGKLIEGNK